MGRGTTALTVSGESGRLLKVHTKKLAGLRLRRAAVAVQRQRRRRNMGVRQQMISLQTACASWLSTLGTLVASAR